MIRIGTSGFSFPEWRGNIYPRHLKTLDMLSYYQNCLGFDMVELDFTFYTFPEAKTMERLARKTNAGFQFLVKANRFMTHVKRICQSSDRNQDQVLHIQFLSALQPLIEQDKLGCVLFQFPRSFCYSSRAMACLSRSRQWMETIPMAVEFRSSSWNREETFAFLQKNEMVFCAADRYQDEWTMPLVNRTTSNDASYFRFHGRGDSWIDEMSQIRHQHLYSQSVLSQFKDMILHVAQKTRTTYICFNNCHAGAAARNAGQLKRMLGVMDAGKGTTVDLFEASHRACF